MATVVYPQEVLAKCQDEFVVVSEKYLIHLYNGEFEAMYEYSDEDPFYDEE